MGKDHQVCEAIAKLPAPEKSMIFSQFAAEHNFEQSRAFGHEEAKWLKRAILLVPRVLQLLL